MGNKYHRRAASTCMEVSIAFSDTGTLSVSASLDWKSECWRVTRRNGAQYNDHMSRCVDDDPVPFYRVGASPTRLFLQRTRLDHDHKSPGRLLNPPAQHPEVRLVPVRVRLRYEQSPGNDETNISDDIGYPVCENQLPARELWTRSASSICQREGLLCLTDAGTPDKATIPGAMETAAPRNCTLHIRKPMW